MPLLEKEFRAAKRNMFTLCIESFLNSSLLRKTKFALSKPFSMIKLKSEILYDIIQDEVCFAFEIPSVSFFMNHEKTIKL